VDEPSILDLWMALEERDGKIIGSVNYPAEFFDRATISAGWCTSQCSSGADR